LFCYWQLRPLEVPDPSRLRPPLRGLLPGLGAGLLAVAAASEHGLEPVDQAAVTERSAGALAGAQFPFYTLDGL
jgi:hypothetical protein